MASKALSLCKGKGSIAHNNREYAAHNVNHARSQDNTVYVSTPIGQAYEDLFSSAVEKFNSKARSDRKIHGSYFEHLFKQSEDSQAAKGVLVGKNKQKSFYEELVQIGDKDDSGVGTADGELVAKCLDKYMRGWQERNPQFHVFNAVLHMDERTPHLHIDYIPVAESSRGLSRQNAISKALEQMGYDTRSDKELGFTAWRKNERAILEGICREHGIIPSEPKPSRGFSLSPDDYKRRKDAEIAALEQRTERLQRKKESLEKGVERSQGTAETMRSDIRGLNQTKRDLVQEVNNLQQNAEKAMQSVFKAQGEAVLIESQRNALQGEIEPLEKRKKRLTDEIAALEQKGSVGLIGENRQLREELKKSQTLFDTAMNFLRDKAADVYNAFLAFRAEKDKPEPTPKIEQTPQPRHSDPQVNHLLEEYSRLEKTERSIKEYKAQRDSLQAERKKLGLFDLKGKAEIDEKFKMIGESMWQAQESLEKQCGIDWRYPHPTYSKQERIDNYKESLVEKIGKAKYEYERHGNRSMGDWKKDIADTRQQRTQNQQPSRQQKPKKEYEYGD